MELNEYLGTLSQRYLKLDEEEKENLRRLRSQPVGETLQKVFGQEMAPLFSQLAQPKPLTPQEPVATETPKPAPKRKPKGLGVRKK